MPFLTDLKLPKYVISLTIPTKYNEIIYERLNILRENLLKIHNSEEEQDLIEQMDANSNPPFVENLPNGIRIQTQEHLFTSPWQLATSLYEMLHLTIQQQINQEKVPSFLLRSDLEDFLATTSYGIKESLENTILRRENEKQLENAERENAMEALAIEQEKVYAEREEALAEEEERKFKEEISMHEEILQERLEDEERKNAIEALEQESAELDEAMKVVPVSYSPNTQELALADNDDKGAEELALEELAQQQDKEFAERDDAMKVVPASYSPNTQELALADNEDKGAEELALEELAQQQDKEEAERDDAMKVVPVSYSPNTQELAIAAAHERALMDAQERNDVAPSARSEKAATPPSDGASTRSITSALAVDSDSENQLRLVQESSSLVTSNESKYRTPIPGIKRSRANALVESHQSNLPESYEKPLKGSRGDISSGYSSIIASRGSSPSGSFAEAVLSSRGSSPSGSFAEAVLSSGQPPLSPSL